MSTPSQQSPHKWMAYFYLVVAQAMVGISIVCSKYLLAHTSATFLIFARFTIGTVLIFLLFLCSKPASRTAKPTKKLSELSTLDWFYLCAQGLSAGVLFNWFFLWGLQYSSASIAGIITSALPAIIAILGIFLLKQRVTVMKLACVFFAVLGLIVINWHSISSDKMNHLWGDLLILVSLLPEACYYILVKKHHAGLPILLNATVVCGVNVPFLFLAVLMVPGHALHDFTAFDALLLLLVGSTSSIFYACWHKGSMAVDASISGLFTALMPLITLVLAGLFLGESLSALQLVGMAMVLCSVVLNARSPKPLSPTEKLV